MDFISINQFFYKLQSALLVILIVPLLVFIALYFHTGGYPPPVFGKEFLIAFTALVLLNWCLAMIIFNKKIKSLRNEQGLGLKLDKYFPATVIRFIMLSSGSLMLALAWSITKEDVFTWIYLAGLMLSLTLWPTSRKITRDLRLRGDEREMVYFKKDTL